MMDGTINFNQPAPQMDYPQNEYFYIKIVKPTVRERALNGKKMRHKK